MYGVLDFFIKWPGGGNGADNSVTHDICTPVLSYQMAAFEIEAHLSSSCFDKGVFLVQKPQLAHGQKSNSASVHM